MSIHSLEYSGNSDVSIEGEIVDKSLRCGGVVAALCFRTPYFSAFLRSCVASSQQFTGDSVSGTRYAKALLRESACEKRGFERNALALAKGVPMSENPQTESAAQRAAKEDELHISRTMAETRRTLQAIIETERATEAKRSAEVPPKRAGTAWSVAERLTRRFGLGGDPERRRRFYAKLEQLVEVHGDAVLTIISDCVWAAEKARSKQRYFCKSVSLRLRENGFGLEGPNNDW